MLFLGDSKKNWMLHLQIPLCNKKKIKNQITKAYFLHQVSEVHIGSATLFSLPPSSSLCFIHPEMLPCHLLLFLVLYSVCDVRFFPQQMLSVSDSCHLETDVFFIFYFQKLCFPEALRQVWWQKSDVLWQWKGEEKLYLHTGGCVCVSWAEVCALGSGWPVLCQDAYPKGVIPLAAIQMARPAKDNKFEVVTHPRIFVFRTENEGLFWCRHDLMFQHYQKCHVTQLKLQQFAVLYFYWLELNFVDVLSIATAMGWNITGTYQRSVSVWEAPFWSWVTLPEAGSPGTKGNQIQSLCCHNHGGDLAIQEWTGENIEMKKWGTQHYLFVFVCSAFVMELASHLLKLMEQQSGMGNTRALISSLHTEPSGTRSGDALTWSPGEPSWRQKKTFNCLISPRVRIIIAITINHENHHNFHN